jgi:hypothetical protein
VAVVIEFAIIAALVAGPDLVTVASAVVDWARPGRHRTVHAHSSIALRAR